MSPNPMDDDTPFAHLVGMAKQQREPQRLLFVFAGAELPDDASPAERAGFERGEGGALAPLFTVDKDPADLGSFAALADEANAMRADWRFVFIAALSGRGAEAPSNQDVERALKRMEDGIKQGSVGGWLVLDRDGQPVQLQ
jgi:hypothetical protein